jgi:NOL1/NOP2/fmu family ribosome biogenesis protein
MLGSTWFEPFRTIELPQDTVREYLSGQALNLEAGSSVDHPPHGNKNASSSLKTPWAVVQWRQKSMGWVKSAGNRLNNHLPPQAILSIGSNGEYEEFTS